MSPVPSFRPHALQFLRRLTRHNERAWFEANRATYESEVLEPLRELVEELDTRLASIAPEIVGHPKRSVFRIYRDVRFSADKSPYKTHAAAWFYHRDADKTVGQGGGGAGFYFHLEPGASLVAGGIWMPPRESLTRIRDAIVRDHRGFARTLAARPLTRRFRPLDEEHMLKRLPRGYSDDSPAAPWLRYQSFTVSRSLTNEEVVRVDLAKVIAKDFTAMLPLVRWLNAALGFPEAARR